jgi:predicted RecA/RadA family phage recombinase
MTNFIQRGDTITAKAPYAVASGAGMQVGAALFGLAASAASLNDITEIDVVGVFDLTKDASTFADGDPVYWDNTAKKATSTSTSNLKIGVATLIQPDGTSALGGATGDATVRVLLIGAH